MPYLCGVMSSENLIEPLTFAEKRRFECRREPQVNTRFGVDCSQ